MTLIQSQFCEIIRWRHVPRAVWFTPKYYDILVEPAIPTGVTTAYINPISVILRVRTVLKA